MRHNDTMSTIVELANDHWQVGLLPDAGGSVAYGRVRAADRWVDVLRPTPDDQRHDPAATASFPLVPWSNRIADGLLTWARRDYQLRRNFEDGTAIHGTGIEYPWAVAAQTDTSATLEFVSRNVYGVNFPWPFTARFTYELDGQRFQWRMEITNDSHETFPAGLGHHPYFLRQLTDAAGASVGDSAWLQVNCAASYPAVGCIPTGPAGPLPAYADYRESRPVGDTFVDDCLTHRTSSTLAVIDYPGALTLGIEAGALLEHAVVYAPVGMPFFAVEPVSNANNGFALDAQGYADTGVFLVQPGETRSTAFTLVAHCPL